MSITPFFLPNDLSDYCRVCLKLPDKSQYLDLTTIYDEEDNLTYGECFFICTQIDLNAGDGVPHYLCKSCGLELQMAYDFLKKLEESKRMIEESQRRLEKQKLNTSSSSGQTDRLHADAIDVSDIIQLDISDDDDDAIVETSQEIIEDLSEMQHANEQEFNTDAETDGVYLINKMCQSEDNAKLEKSLDKVSNTTLEHKKVYNVDGDGDEEKPLEIEDYQNLEALDDEETETLQIKCGENILPLQITKYKTIECEENEIYVEYEHDLEVEEEVQQELDAEYEEEDVEHLRWQDNVVAVASKEHLPIEHDDFKEDGVDDQTLQTEEISYETFENQTIVYESSQDENVEQYEDEKKDNEKIVEKKENSKTNQTPRKRHVGSYSCDYCQRVFPNYSRMKTHRRCHETDRPKFSCSHCDRIYATKQARDSHVQTAHEKSGYICNICNKVFAIRKSLEIHIRYHTGDFPYECNLCDKKFAQMCHLNTHINVKHNKIRFSCDYSGCRKFFTSSSSLRNHQYTHGIMPFECEYCQQGYPAKAKLRVHIQRKHFMELNNDQLEKMRKFHVMRSKVSLVQFVET